MPISTLILCIARAVRSANGGAVRLLKIFIAGVGAESIAAKNLMHMATDGVGVQDRIRSLNESVVAIV